MDVVDKGPIIEISTIIYRLIVFDGNICHYISIMLGILPKAIAMNMIVDLLDITIAPTWDNVFKHMMGSVIRHG